MVNPNPESSLKGCQESFQLGDWFIQPQLGQVQNDQKVHRLEPRVMQLLAILAAQPERVLTRTELLAALWPDTIVCEDALTKVVSELRRTLGDDPKSPRLIETIPKKGYRLLAEVSLPKRQRQSRVRLGWLAFCALLIPALVVATVLMMKKEAPVPLSAIGGRPLTSYQGAEQFPAISPDGTMVAFSKDMGHGTDLDVYVKNIDSDNLIRLTDQPGPETCPAWSPDGKTIAFLGFEMGNRAVFSISLIGAQKTLLAEIETGPPGLDWSPAGLHLALAATGKPDAESGIILLSMATGEIRRLTVSPPNYFGDRDPVFVEDGSSLVFVRRNNAKQDDLYAVSLVSDEKPRQLTADQIAIGGLCWDPVREHILFASAPDGVYRLLDLDMATKQTTWLRTTSEWALNPSLDATGQNLVYAGLSIQIDVHERPLPSPGKTADISDMETILIQSTRLDSGASVSPDGTRLAFVSTRSGNPEVWLANRDGSQAKQLSRFGGGTVLAPRWSPDGSHLAVSATIEQKLAIHLLDISTSVSKRLTDSDTNEVLAFWSASREWIVFESDSGPDQAWHFERINIESGEVEKEMYSGQLLVRETPSGKKTFYIKGHPCQVFWRDSDGQEGVLAIDGELAVENDYPYVPLDRGILYFLSAPDGRFLDYLDFATGISQRIMHFPGSEGRGLTVSPDGENILFERFDFESDVFLVENLQ